MFAIKPPVLSSDRGNMSFITHAQQQNESESSSNLFSILYLDIRLAVFGFAYTICFLINQEVIYIIYKRFPKRTQLSFSQNVLVVHLSLICIGITTLSLLDTLESQELLPNFGPLFRHISDFFKDSLICGFSLNIVLLVYQLVFKPAQSSDPSVFEYLGLSWILACTQGFFTEGFVCLMTLKLPNKLALQIAGITCDILKYILFHLSVSSFVGYALFKSLQLAQLTNQIENIQYLRIHLYTFVIVWISYGLWNITLRFALFLELDLEQYFSIIDSIRISLYTYLALNPMIYTLLLDFQGGNNSSAVLCAGIISKRRDNFEEKTFAELSVDGFSTTVKVTYPQGIENQQRAGSSVSYVPVEVHSTKLDQEGFLPNKMDEHDICMESDMGSLAGNEGKMSGRETKVRFCDKIETRYFEKEDLDGSNLKRIAVEEETTLDNGN